MYIVVQCLCMLVCGFIGDDVVLAYTCVASVVVFVSVSADNSCVRRCGGGGGIGGLRC